MSGFNSAFGGDFDKYFMTTTDLIDRYAQGGLWGWGNNSQGGLGTNDIVHRSTPVQTISGGTNWKQVSEAYGFWASAIKTDGTLWTWGFNFNGNLGTNDRVYRSTPVQVFGSATNWKQVSAGGTHIAAIKTDGTLWTCGYNKYGNLGTNDIVHRSTPTQVTGGGTNWKQVSAGNFGTAAIKTDGTLWIWGRNSAGQLGTNDRTDRSTPVQTISGGTNWKQVSAATSGIAAIKTDGTLWTCGSNDFGRLGTNDTANRSTPVQTTAGGTNWKQVSAGRNNTAAIKTDGTLWSCGYNLFGQLGTNDTANRSTPVQTAVGGTNWKQVGCGSRHMSAIKTDGTLWSCGYNVSGRLGTNDTANRSTPVQTTAGGTNWKQVSAGNFSTKAIQYSDIGQIL